MTDNELRGILLRHFYEHRRDGWVRPKPEDLDPQIEESEITRISRQLSDHNLLKAAFQPGPGLMPHGPLEKAYISSDGIDVIEGTKEPPISIELHDNRRIDNRSYNIQHSTAVAVGDNSRVEFILERFEQELEDSNLSDTARHSLLEKAKSVLKHPLLVKAMGTLGDKL